MEDNRQIARSMVQKADTKISDMVTNGGALQQEQAKKFFQIPVPSTVITPMATMVPMNAPVQEISRIGFLSRIARRGAEGVALSAADRATWTNGKLTLTSQLIKCQVDLTEEELTDTVEGDQFEETVLKLMKQAFGLDLEDLVLNGDTDSADPLLALMNGIIKKASSHVVDNGVVPFAQSHLYSMSSILPSQFQRDKSQMKYFTSPKGELKWRDINASRAGGGGGLADAAITSAAPIPAYGIQVVGVPLIPDTLGGGSETTTLLTDPKNIAIGVYKNVTIKTQEDVQGGKYVIVGRVRAAVDYFYEPAVSKAVKQTV